ncbi:hypothetical protein ACFWA9_32010 [Kitasatospora sp. NPDC059973]|uniref:hypothetical protein n=1 Tax=Kitasatospora sp. NPDC059973 TaxID=3347020 RepID=UPI0036CDDE56
METAELESKVHGLETALAVQEANLAGAQATQAATQAGMSSTFAATHAGTWSVMAVGSVALVVGLFLGMAIAKH